MRFSIRSDKTGSAIYQDVNNRSAAAFIYPIRPATVRQVMDLLVRYFPDKLQPKRSLDDMVLDGHQGHLVITRRNPNHVATVSTTFSLGKEPSTAEQLMRLLETEFAYAQRNRRS